MGVCTLKGDRTDTTVSSSQNGLTKSDFDLQHVVGRGGFGRVWQAQHREAGTMHAIKEMSKARVLAKKSTSSVMNERKILELLRHPFLVNMHYAFQDSEHLYLVLDLKLGGDLRFHMSRLKRFSERQTSTIHSEFFVACILQSLEFIHDRGILHRDIKPENLVFDASGYLHLTDFGIARLWHPENARDTSGTPGYMAPEVMCRQNHGMAVDYFALGVICYECVTGDRPYVGKNRKEIRAAMLEKQAMLHENELPPGWSTDALDFINRLLQRKPIHRLGSTSSQELKLHPWLFSFPWSKLVSKHLEAPFIPPTQDNFDLSVQSQKDAWSENNQESLQQSALQLKQACVQQMFAGYYYEPALSTI